MITPGFSLTSTERVLPSLALDFTTAVADARVSTVRALNTATRTSPTGALEIVNANLPRFDYSPVNIGVCLGQLIEETRTNVFLNSLINGTSLSTQSVTLPASAHTLSFYGTGSIAISGGHTATISGIGVYPQRQTYTFTPAAGSTTFTVTGTVQYAQLEAGSFPTSFIPTAATSLTRNADGVTMTGTNFSSWYNTTEGALVISGDVIRAPTNVVQFAGLFFDYSNFLRIRCNGTSSPDGNIFSSGISQMSLTSGSITSNTPFKCVLSYAANNSNFGLNGTTAVTRTTVTLPTPNMLAIGSLEGANGFMSGHISSVRYYRQRISNAEMAAFTK